MEQGEEGLSAWMQKDIAQKMMQGPKWLVALVRTDTWFSVTDAGVAEKLMNEEECWVERHISG